MKMMFVLMNFDVNFSTQEVPQSPFHVKVDPSHDASKVKAEGPGLSRTGETHTHTITQ